jgi:hypothetical protein
MDAPFGGRTSTGEDVRCCAGPKGRSRPFGNPDQGDKPLDPKVEGSLVGCARGYALSYVAGGGVGTRSVAIGGVVCVLLIGALFYMFLTVLIVIPNKPLGDVRNLIALHCITL